MWQHYFVTIWGWGHSDSIIFCCERFFTHMLCFYVKMQEHLIYLYWKPSKCEHVGERNKSDGHKWCVTSDEVYHWYTIRRTSEGNNSHQKNKKIPFKKLQSVHSITVRNYRHSKLTRLKTIVTNDVKHKWWCKRSVTASIVIRCYGICNSAMPR